jgi:hypothetical protein
MLSDPRTRSVPISCHRADFETWANGRLPDAWAGYVCTEGVAPSISGRLHGTGGPGLPMRKFQ